MTRGPVGIAGGGPPVGFGASLVAEGGAAGSFEGKRWLYGGPLLILGPEGTPVAEIVRPAFGPLGGWNGAEGIGGSALKGCGLATTGFSTAGVVGGRDGGGP